MNLVEPTSPTKNPTKTPPTPPPTTSFQPQKNQTSRHPSIFWVILPFHPWRLRSYPAPGPPKKAPPGAVAGPPPGLSPPMRTTAAGGPVAYKAPPPASIGTWEGAVGVAVGEVKILERMKDFWFEQLIFCKIWSRIHSDGFMFNRCHWTTGGNEVFQ